VQDPPESSQKSGFAQTRHAFEKHVSASHQANQDTINDILLSYNDFRDFFPYAIQL